MPEAWYTKPVLTIPIILAAAASLAVLSVRDRVQNALTVEDDHHEDINDAGSFQEPFDPAGPPEAQARFRIRAELRRCVDTECADLVSDEDVDLCLRDCETIE